MLENFSAIHTDRKGNHFLIRPIVPSDKEYLKIGLKELSTESRHQRFHLGKTEFSENELKYLTEVDMNNHIAFVTSLQSSPQDLPAGVIRGIRSQNDPTKLEIAVTIIDQYQHRGLGHALMGHLKEYALPHGFTHFIGDLHNTNEKMLHLLQKYTFKDQDLLITHVGDGFLYFELCLK
jgi:GNAT superfamily N-acetyltransferase